MDNKRLNYFEDEDEKEFFACYYEDYLKQKKEIIYVFEDYVIYKPVLKDMMHVLSCMLQDTGISKHEMFNEENDRLVNELVAESWWMFTYNDDENEFSHLYMMFKDNEYVGYATIADNPDLGPVTGTKLFIREKFRKTIAIVCFYDCGINVKYPNQKLNINSSSDPDMLQVDTLPKFIEASSHSIDKYKYVVHNILNSRQSKR